MKGKLLDYLISFIFLSVFIINPFINISAQTISGGGNAARIEQEDKISVPFDKAEEVWDFLNSQYVVNIDKLKILDPLLTSITSDENFQDIYFDTFDLKLYKNNNGVRYRLRLNITNPDDPKNEQELIQIKISNVSDNPLDRNEYKYTLVQNADRILNSKNRSSLLGIIKKSEQQDFIDQLLKLDINANDLRPIVSLNDWRKRIYILRDSKSFISISFDHATAELGGKKADFYEIEPELNEIVYTTADPDARRYMEEINKTIINDIKQNFPDLKSDLTPKYSRAYNLLKTQIPYLDFLVVLNMHDSPELAYIIIVIFFGLVLISIFIGFYLLIKKRAKIE